MDRSCDEWKSKASPQAAFLLCSFNPERDQAVKEFDASVGKQQEAGAASEDEEGDDELRIVGGGAVHKNERCPYTGKLVRGMGLGRVLAGWGHGRGKLEFEPLGFDFCTVDTAILSVDACIGMSLEEGGGYVQVLCAA